MTAAVVDMFREGQTQEAVELATSFAEAARETWGRTHPTYINALATVAAMVAQAGDSEQAEVLLKEAENLHEELEMEVMAEALDDEIAAMSSGESDGGEGGDGRGGAGKRGVHRAPGGRRRRKKTRAVAQKADAANEDAGGAFLTGVDAEEAKPGSDEGSYSDDDDWSDGSGSRGSEGDVEGGRADTDDEDDEDDKEAEAKAITQLTWEVNALLAEGDSEKAAQLLNEAEQTLMAGVGYDLGRIHGVSRAALHTLWAAVLDSVGENEKARLLYDEAMVCLTEEQAMAMLSDAEGSESSTSLDGGCTDGSDEGSESEEPVGSSDDALQEDRAAGAPEDQRRNEGAPSSGSGPGGDAASGPGHAASSAADGAAPLLQAAQRAGQAAQAALGAEAPAPPAPESPAQAAGRSAPPSAAPVQRRAGTGDAAASSSRGAAGQASGAEPRPQSSPLAVAAVVAGPAPPASTTEAEVRVSACPGAAEAPPVPSPGPPAEIANSSPASAAADCGSAGMANTSGASSGSQGIAGNAPLVPSPPRMKASATAKGGRPGRRPVPLAPQPKTATKATATPSASSSSAAGAAAAPKAAPAPKPAAVAAASGMATTPASEAPKRAGGGFAITAPQPPKGAPSGPTPRRPPGRAKPKTKASSSAAAGGKAAGGAPSAEAEEAAPVEAALEPAATPAAPAEAQQDPSAEAKPEVPKTPEEQRVEITRAMTCADHFLGLLDFERAADQLEEQLVQFSQEGSAHKHGDLHVQVLVKYGGVLWWDGDHEGAIDAFLAADEVLEGRPDSEEPSIRRRRADVWAQLAQVHRGVGNLEEADRRLSEAVACLSELKTAEGVAAAGHEATAQLSEIVAAAQDGAAGDAQKSSKSASSSSSSSAAAGSAEGTVGADGRAGGRRPEVHDEDTSEVSLGDALRDAQASLGQVCVQKRDYKRAEELYLAAFTDEPTEEATEADKASSATNEAS